MRTSCTDVCELVTDTMLMYDCGIDPNSDNHDDIIEAWGKYRQAHDELLEACKMVERAWAGNGVDMAEAVDACLLAITKAGG